MKWIIRHWDNQMTPWMWGLKFPDRQEILIAGYYMGTFQQAFDEVQRLISEFDI